jgi:hypothetical protein
MAEDPGFQIRSHEWACGYYATLAYQLGFAAWVLPSRPRHWGGVSRGVITAVFAWLLKCQFYLLSFIMFARMYLSHKYTSSRHRADYAFTAIRPHKIAPENKGVSDV